MLDIKLLLTTDRDNNWHTWQQFAGLEIAYSNLTIVITITQSLEIKKTQ